ncbi:hypothetical protein [Candidatus Chloroploca asiatica]|uniref:hypothetical protein n=1 Tax=Candidatus Chloroploca asiatica TaxID=1506545 RepID=UPI001144B2EB|nr:hypothetical protein [Candidatus Chloroploca asiatica]
MHESSWGLRNSTTLTPSAPAGACGPHRRASRAAGASAARRGGLPQAWGHSRRPAAGVPLPASEAQGGMLRSPAARTFHSFRAGRGGLVTRRLVTRPPTQRWGRAGPPAARQARPAPRHAPGPAGVGPAWRAGGGSPRDHAAAGAQWMARATAAVGDRGLA